MQQHDTRRVVALEDARDTFDQAVRELADGDLAAGVKSTYLGLDLAREAFEELIDKLG